MEYLIILDDMPELTDILNDKFVEVSTELKNVLKIASKGPRKGLIIFKPDAANLIYAIKDKFVQYVVRSIFDNYNDQKNGVLFRMHCNEIFNGDFIKTIFRKMNPLIDALENEYSEMREKHIHNPELWELNELISHKYQIFLSERRNQNVFNVNNPYSKPFFEKYNELKRNVKKLHPRVPDDKMDKYIDKDYTFRNQKQKLEKEHIETFTEYNNAKSRKNEIYDIQNSNEKVLTEKIKEEYSKMDYNKIRGALQKMIDQFITVIVNSIIKGTINLS